MKAKVSVISVNYIIKVVVTTLVGILRTASDLGSPRGGDFSADCAGAFSPDSFLLLAGGVCLTGLAQAMISLSPGNVAVESIPKVSIEFVWPCYR